MAEHIWSSPRLFVKYDGDREAAWRMERRARACVGYLMDQLRMDQQRAEDALGPRFKYLKGGLSDQRILGHVAGGDLQAMQAEFARRMASLSYPTYRVQSWNYNDGSRIKAHVWRDMLGERAIVWITAVGEEQMQVLHFYWDAGLLTWVPNPDFRTYPLRVYVGDEIKTLPIVQELDENNSYASQYWTEDVPADEYPDSATDYRMDLHYWPSMWTGKARLMLQTCHAIHRDPREIFGYAMDCNTDGIWMTSIGQYWAVRVNSSGVVVTRLDLPEELPKDVIAARIVLLTPKGRSKHELSMAEGRLMSVLTNSGVSHLIMDSATIAPVFADGLYAWTGGWKFARNKLEVSIAVRRTEWMPEYYEVADQTITHLFTIKGEYIDGEWQTATLEHPYGPVRSRLRPGWTSVWKPSYGALGSWNYIGDVPTPFGGYYTEIGDTVSPYYCFYDVQDLLQVVWYVQYQLTGNGDDTRPAYGETCTGPWVREGHFGGNYESQGGFVLSEIPPDPADYKDGYRSNYTVERFVCSVTPGAGQINISQNFLSSGSNFYVMIANVCDADDVAAWVIEHDPFIPGQPAPFHVISMTAQIGFQSEFIEQTTYNSTPRQWSLIFPAYESECVYILNTAKVVYSPHERYTSWSGSISKRFPTLPIYGGSTEYRFYDPSGNLMETFQTNTMIKTNEPYIYNYGSWFGAIINETTREVWDSEVLPVAAITPPKYLFHSPHGTIELPDDGYWPTMFPETALEAGFIEGQPVRAALSYNGDGLYYTEEGETADIGGYAPAIPGIGGIFIGGA